MTNVNDVRRAHRLVIALKGGSILSSHDADFLRSFLPELPKQKTLEEITEHVRNAWVGASGNEWAGNSYNREIALESWMGELYVQLQGLADAEPAKPAHPAFLETEADYQRAPEGTIVALDDTDTVWLKKFGAWRSTAGDHGVESACIALDSRRVLRWSWGE